MTATCSTAAARNPTSPRAKITFLQPAAMSSRPPKPVPRAYPRFVATLLTLVMVPLWPGDCSRMRALKALNLKESKRCPTRMKATHVHRDGAAPMSKVKRLKPATPKMVTFFLPNLFTKPPVT